MYITFDRDKGQLQRWVMPEEYKGQRVEWCEAIVGEGCASFDLVLGNGHIVLTAPVVSAGRMRLPDGMTPLQRDIADLLMLGYNRKEASGMLGIPKTKYDSQLRMMGEILAKSGEG